jgi:hypothetical protein
MALRVLLGSLASALMLMLWGFLFWVVLSAPGGALRAIPDEPPLLETLLQSLPESGSYYFPLPPETTGAQQGPPDMEAFRLRHMAGPVGLLHFSREGADPLAFGMYARGFAHLFVSSFIAALFLLAAQPILDTYLQRVLFVFGLGLFGVVAMSLSEPVWWHLPWAHYLNGALFHLSGWFLAALVLAGTVRPSRGAPHVTDPSKPLWKRALDVE